MIDIGGFKFHPGTLGGKNSWINWGEINDRGADRRYVRNDLSQTRMAKTFAASAHTLRVSRFFGKTAT